MHKTASVRRTVAAITIVCLTLPQTLWAQSALDDSPHPAAMVGDLLIARPVGVVLTVGGAAAFLVSLPFTLLAGHAGEAADKLIVGPGATTFMRCLGCRETGYTYKDIDSSKARKERAAAEAAAEAEAE